MNTFQELINDGVGPNLLLNRIERALKRAKQHENVKMVVKGYKKIGPYDAVELEMAGKKFRITVKEIA